MNRRRNGDNCYGGLAYVMSRRAEIDDIRKANARKRAAFTGKALRLDDCLKDDHGRDRENRLMSDRGKGAEEIRRAGENPVWHDLFNKAYDELPDNDRAVIDALFQDMRPAQAARIAGVSRQTVYRALRRFRERLIPAYRAWQQRDTL